MFVFVDLVDDSFFYELSIFFDSIHVDMKQFPIVDVEIGVGRALYVMFVQS